MLEELLSIIHFSLFCSIQSLYNNIFLKFRRQYFRPTLQVVEAVFSAGATFEPSAEQNGIAEPSTQAAFVLRSSVFFTPHLQYPVAVSHTFTRVPKAVCLVERQESTLH